MSLDEEQARIGAFERRTRMLLKESIANPSPQVRARIARVRERALRESAREPYSWAPKVWVPAGAMAVLAAILLVQVGHRERSVPVPAVIASVPADDVALLLNADNLDLLEQLEFYLWLEREPGALDADPAAHRRASRS